MDSGKGPTIATSKTHPAASMWPTKLVCSFLMEPGAVCIAGFRNKQPGLKFRPLHSWPCDLGRVPKPPSLQLIG